MIRDEPSGVHVVDGDEIAAAAVRWPGGVRVDQHHGNLRVPEDAYDLLVRFDHFLCDKGAEDHAFRTADGKFAHLAPYVAYQRFVLSLAREDKRDAVSEPRCMQLRLLLYLDEEFV